MIMVKRIYEPASPDDGYRVLVDRLWPRGVLKAAAAIDAWRKEVTPSTELRQWLHADPSRWAEFRTRYVQELSLLTATASLCALRQRAAAGPITLLTAARNDETHAHILREVLTSGDHTD